MPTATPSPTQNPPLPNTPPPTPFQSATHHLSLLLLLASPLLIALPPRKLDLYTASLATAWLVSANHITHERTGAGILENVGRRLHREGTPRRERDFARGNGAMGGWDRDLDIRRPGAEGRGGADGRVPMATGRADGDARAGSTAPQRGKEEAKGVAGLARALWMGQEEEGWAERRGREEREKLAEGRGYGGLIVDQIWEVWNWDKKPRKEGEEEEEEGEAKR